MSIAPRSLRGDAKRRSVVEAATHAFLSDGYGAVSMDAIAAAAQASKRTVYNHFPSKRELFAAVVAQLYDGMDGPAHERMTPDQPPETALPDFARTLLAHLRRPEVTGLLRLVIAEHRRFPELAQVLLNEGKGPAVAPLRTYLAGLNERGVLRIPDPAAAAGLFLGGIKESLFWPMLLGLPVSDDGPVIAAAVDTFLRAHRAD